MQSLSQYILEHASILLEGTPLFARELLHLGDRAAIDQALSRLARRGTLIRIARGIYVLSVVSRFGTRAPSVTKVVERFAVSQGEVIVPHSAAVANALGLTTQVPMRAIYLTSGPSRHLKLGAQTLEFRHAPTWQLNFSHAIAGDVIRVLIWIGPEKAREAITKLRVKLSPNERQEVIAVRAQMPTWMAREIGALEPRG